MPIEHNRDRPSRESVKEPQRSSLRRPGDYFPFVNTQKKGDTWDVRVIIGKKRIIQKYSRDRRHQRIGFLNSRASSPVRQVFISRPDQLVKAHNERNHVSPVLCCSRCFTTQMKGSSKCVVRVSSKNKLDLFIN